MSHSNIWGPFSVGSLNFDFLICSVRFCCPWLPLCALLLSFIYIDLCKYNWSFCELFTCFIVDGVPNRTGGLWCWRHRLKIRRTGKVFSPRSRQRRLAINPSQNMDLGWLWNPKTLKLASLLPWYFMTVYVLQLGTDPHVMTCMHWYLYFRPNQRHHVRHDTHTQWANQ